MNSRYDAKLQRVVDRLPVLHRKEMGTEGQHLFVLDLRALADSLERKLAWQTEDSESE